MAKKLAAFAAVLTALVLFFALGASAQSAPVFGTVADPEAKGNTDIYIQETDGTNYLFLPASASLERMNLVFRGGEATIANGTVTRQIKSGETFDLTRLFPGGTEEYTLTFVQRNRHIKFTVLRSENVRSLFITSADRENRGREWVEFSRENRAGGGAVLLRPDGTVTYAGDIKSIRGRGNSTWNYPKKPYQLRLSSPADLLDGGEEKKNDTWLLLANYIDGTLVHNSLTLDLARELKTPYPISAEPVDLYYDGEYRGSYLLAEKPEISVGRVEERDLEAEIAKENAGASEDDLREITVRSFEDESAFRFTEGLEPPRDLSGGYLMELEFENRAITEPCWFKTRRQQYVVVKSPERLPHDAVTYVMGLYESFESAVYGGGVDPETGKDYRDLCDLDSLARAYVIMEFCADNDGFRSSTFFYKPAGEEKLYFGPLWDFDTGYGSANTSQERFVVARSPLGSALMGIASFRERAAEIYREELEPLVDTVILGGEEARGESLCSIEYYTARTAASRRMNDLLWPKYSEEDPAGSFRAFVTSRREWLSAEIASWNEGAPVGRSFFDVSEEDWYYDAVNFVSDMGMMPGSSDVSFSPNELCTVGQVKAALEALAGGVIPGLTDGLSGLDAPVTRGELMTMLYRYAKNAGKDVSARADLKKYEDGGEVQDPAAMSWALAMGITSGVGQRTAWNETITRAYTAVILYRLYTKA